MRIDAYAQVQQAYKTSKTRKPNATQAYSNDYNPTKVEISDFGKAIQSAKQAVADTPDIRTELVNSIKERVQNGSYDVDLESFADKLFQRFKEQNDLF